MSEKRTDGNPSFNDWRGLSNATEPPPYDFRNVVFRHFPLEAKLTALQVLCDSYLNIAPGFAYFRPAMPYVILSIGHYGDMEVATSRYGWSSQYEYFFSVPIEWYERDGDGWRFKTVCSFTPFIFLDNEYAEIDGREMYGWPKAQSWLKPTLDAWADNPSAPRRPMTFQTRVFDKLYSGRRATIRDFMYVEELPAYSPTEFPPERSGRNNPWMTWSRSMMQWSNMYQSAVMNWSGALTREATGQYPDGLPPYGLESLQATNAFMSTLVTNTINLKQIRDINNPQEYCYQAITQATLQVSQLQRSGLVGDVAQLAGDPTGAYRIHLNRYPSHPIVDTLGLLTEPESTKDVDVLAPLMPFWQELDWSFQSGSRICWRTCHEDWRNESSPQMPPPPPIDRGFVTTGVLDYQVATGPFRFLDCTLRILPLLASPDALESVCNEYINSNDADRHCRVEPWGRYVFCVVTSFGSMTSETDNFGQWADTNVQFLIPVRRSVGGELAGLGVINPFSYSNSDIGTTTAREVFGWTTNMASIAPGTSNWLDRNRDPLGNHQELMRLGTETWPGPGQKSQWANLIRIVRSTRKNGQIRDKRYLSSLEDENRRAAAAAENCPDTLDHLTTLVLELLQNEEPVNFIALKQFRNAGDPARAAYQEISQLPVVISTVKSIKVEKKPLDLVILPVPTQPIARRLGLVQHAHDFNGEPAQVFRVEHPIYLRADLHTLPGEAFCWRADSEHWHPGPAADITSTYLRAGGHPKLSANSLNAFFETDSDDASSSRIADKNDPISKEEAVVALSERELEPIMVLRKLAENLPEGDDWLSS